MLTKNTILLVTLLCLFSCKKDNPQANNPCDADEISYSQHVFPLIKQQCLSCHNASIHDGGIILDSYQAILSSAQSSELYDSVVEINGVPPKMPKGGRLSTCETEILNKWIKQGMKNN